MTQVRRGHRPPAADVVREHRNWLALVEVTGPFLSLPVRRATWPTLEPIDAAERDALRRSHGAWRDDVTTGQRRWVGCWATFSAGLTTCGARTPRT